MNTKELADLIEIELEHGCDDDTPTKARYLHVASCVQEAGWQWVEPGGGAYSAEDVLGMGATITAILQAGSAAMNLLAMGQRVDPEEEME